MNKTDFINEETKKDLELKNNIFDLAKELVTIINEIDQKKAEKMQNREKS